MKRDWKSIAATLIIVLIILSTVLVVVLPKFPLAVAKRTFDYASTKIVDFSGLSPWLVKGILVFALFPFYWALLEIAKFRLFRTNKSTFRRKTAKIVILAYSGLFFLTIYFVSRNNYFSHFEGKAYKFYAITPEGIRFFDNPGFDPKYGIALKPATQQIIDQMQRAKMGKFPNKIEYRNDLIFFDKISGSPKIWYEEDPQGEIDLFDQPGFHPARQKELLPITPDIIARLIKKRRENIAASETKKARFDKEERVRQRNAFLSEFIDTSTTNNPSLQEAALLVVGETGTREPLIESELSNSLSFKGKTPTLSLFKEKFLQSPYLQKGLKGDISFVSDLDLGQHIDVLFLGQAKTNYQIQSGLSDIITATISISLLQFKTLPGRMVRSDYLTSVGSGFSESESKKNAIEKLKDQLSAILQ